MLPRHLKITDSPGVLLLRISLAVSASAQVSSVAMFGWDISLQRCDHIGNRHGAMYVHQCSSIVVDDELNTVRLDRMQSTGAESVLIIAMQLLALQSQGVPMSNAITSTVSANSASIKGSGPWSTMFAAPFDTPSIHIRLFGTSLLHDPNTSQHLIEIPNTLVMQDTNNSMIWGFPLHLHHTSWGSLVVTTDKTAFSHQDLGWIDVAALNHEFQIVALFPEDIVNILFGTRRSLDLSAVENTSSVLAWGRVGTNISPDVFTVALTSGGTTSPEALHFVLVSSTLDVNEESDSGALKTFHASKSALGQPARLMRPTDHCGKMRLHLVSVDDVVVFGTAHNLRFLRRSKTRPFYVALSTTGAELFANCCISDVFARSGDNQSLNLEMLRAENMHAFAIVSRKLHTNLTEIILIHVNATGATALRVQDAQGNGIHAWVNETTTQRKQGTVGSLDVKSVIMNRMHSRSMRILVIYTLTANPNMPLVMLTAYDNNAQTWRELHSLADALQTTKHGTLTYPRTAVQDSRLNGTTPSSSLLSWNPLSIHISAAANSNVLVAWGQSMHWSEDFGDTFHRLVNVVQGSTVMLFSFCAKARATFAYLLDNAHVCTGSTLNHVQHDFKVQSPAITAAIEQVKMQPDATHSFHLELEFKTTENVCIVLIRFRNIANSAVPTELSREKECNPTTDGTSAALSLRADSNTPGALRRISFRAHMSSNRGRRLRFARDEFPPHIVLDQSDAFTFSLTVVVPREACSKGGTLLCASIARSQDTKWLPRLGISPCDFQLHTNAPLFMKINTTVSREAMVPTAVVFTYHGTITDEAHVTSVSNHSTSLLQLSCTIPTFSTTTGTGSQQWRESLTVQAGCPTGRYLQYNAHRSALSRKGDLNVHGCSLNASVPCVWFGHEYFPALDIVDTVLGTRTAFKGKFNVTIIAGGDTAQTTSSYSAAEQAMYSMQVRSAFNSGPVYNTHILRVLQRAFYYYVKRCHAH